MDREQLAHFKKILAEQLAHLEEQAFITAIELAQGGVEIEYVDRAATHRDQDMKLRIKSRESRLIKKIRLALDRIENGTYGICEACEEPISLRRLEARPVTTKCIDCKEREELLEAQSH
ncbi:MAG: TraR/DksA C4-type zinc finger protein [Desulfobacter sp.]|nr:MAG: TraR/DksA C4-type zinc finger protein [Desulfobacter sp.]